MRSGTSTAAADPGSVIGVLQGARRRRRARLELGSAHVAWDPEAALDHQLAKNAVTWEALERLGIRPGCELPVDFYFESAGALADRRLADFLRADLGYDAEVDADGVSGRTPALAVSRELLDRWVHELLVAGHQCGGCRFAGWSVTVARS